MADEKAVLARARDYLQALSEGRDPLSGKAVDDEILSQPRLQRCFAFVAAYLQRELTRSVQNEELFLPTQEEAARICSEEDVALSEFYEKLSDVATARGVAPIPPRTINHFLLRAGLVEGCVESVFVERRVLRAGARAEELGIYDKPRLAPRTGALTHTLMLSPDAQHWLLSHLPQICASEQGTEEEALV